MPELPRAFKTPLVPLVPILGIITCLFMMVFLPADTWVRLIVWMLIGLDIYLVYGVKNSLLGDGTDNRRGMKTARLVGIALSVLLLIVGFLHQVSAGFDSDYTLLIISIAFGLFHIFLYLKNIVKFKDTEQKI
jgi:APA family basic amino acid/polyamine antiporter